MKSIIWSRHGWVMAYHGSIQNELQEGVRMHQYRGIWWMAVLLAIVGCTTPSSRPEPSDLPSVVAVSRVPLSPVVENTASPVATDWRRDWLRGSPCGPPCVFGITPGTLSQTATIDLVSQTFPDSSVEVLQKPEVAQGAIRWLADESDPESHISALFYHNPLTLYAVPLNTVIAVRLGNRAVLPLEDVLEAYGEPSHVLALARPSAPDRTTFIVMFVYLEHGFNLTLSFNYDGIQPILDRSMMVERIHFFPPGVEGFEGAIGVSMNFAAVGTFLVPWNGFVPFEEYCHEVPNPDFPERRGCP